MLTFSTTQLTQFEDRVIARFVERTLTAVLPADDAGGRRVEAAALRRRIALAVARARGYGMRLDTHLEAFARLMLQYGPGFDMHPAVRAILTDRGIPDRRRMDALQDGLAQRHWDELAILADDDLWQTALGGGAA